MIKTPRVQAATGLDRLISYIAPGIATKRLLQRAQFDALSGAGYTGARTDSTLSHWNPGAGSANTDTLYDLPTLRARSRDQMRNAPIALGALNTACTNVIGTGLSLSPAIDTTALGLTQAQADRWQTDTKRRFNAWAASADADLARQANFYALQELAFRSVLESGDTFVVTPRVTRDNQAAPTLALQIIEADRVFNPQYQTNTEALIEGIELNPDTGEPMACHIARHHPGDYTRTSAQSWQRVAYRGTQTGRRNVLHLMRALRPGQVRGVPWIAPILEPLKQLDRYTAAELNAAVTNAIFSVFVKMDPDAFEQVFNPDEQTNLIQKADPWTKTGAMDSGKAVRLLPGESIDSATPGRPNAQFDPFVGSILRQIGTALEIPFEVLVMHFQSSYSAARGALLMAWKHFKSRRDWLATVFCQPVYELWLTDEIAAGRIAAPGYLASPLMRTAWLGAIWTGDGPGSIDPTKEVTAAAARVTLGISTLQAESILHDGIDWDTKHTQRVKEINAQRRDGIYTPPAGSQAPQQPTQHDQSDPQNPKDPEDPEDQEDTEDSDPRPATNPAQRSAVQPIAGAGLQHVQHLTRVTQDHLAQNARTLDAMAASMAQISAAANKPPQPVDVHVHNATPNIVAHVTAVLPDNLVALEANIQQPAIHITAPPAQVLVQPAAAAPKQNARQVHKRDADGNLVETITTFEPVQ